MTRNELARQLVLAEIADDYEEPNHVWENLEQRAKSSGIAITKSEIYDLLLEAVADGLEKDLRSRGAGPRGRASRSPSPGAN